ncbi:MAG: S8 family serine peptidase [Chloroflexota bacterium]|nr:S8 family serine peptidase [Chloroflexota bacterium]
MPTLGREASLGLGRAIVTLTVVSLLFLHVGPGTTFGRPAVDPASKIDGRVIADTANGRRAPVIVYLADQADVSAAAAMTDHDARGWFVYRTLTEHAERTQAGLRGFFKARGVPFRSFWVANMLAVEADLGLVETLAARGDVARIDSNQPTRWIDEPLEPTSDATTEATTSVTLGVRNVRAPAVWSLGYTGQGIVMASQDTGVRWTHTALKKRYRGWNGSSANHNYNWHDAIHRGGGICGPDTTAPCDDHGHGTHTVGTFLGDDGSTRIGVAPGAKWVACRNMNQGSGTPSSYAECFEFFIAPTNLKGTNPNPALRPHVINNSWVCTPGEGCTTGRELETILKNAQASGIFIVAAAGNDGPSCSTIDYPPAIYPASFTIGATDASTNTLAGFSSRGPAYYNGSTILKPNISAPGVSVRSADRTSNTAYSYRSGTSMAAPHVAGVVALLWSARPHLVRDIPATRTALLRSANGAVTVSPNQTCGGRSSTSIPNNSFGYGRVDALAALEAAPPPPSPTPSPSPTATPTASPTLAPTAAPTSDVDPPPATVPDAPRDVVATAADASAHVSWSAPASDGGSAITGYTVTSDPGALTCATAGELSCTVGGLTNGTTYTFTVSATNAIGTGPPSAPSNSVTPSAPDTSAPIVSAPRAAFVSPQQVSTTVATRVSWTAATDPSGIASYRLQRSQDGGSWTTVTLPSPSATSVTIRLASGAYHRFRLRATDGAGNVGAYVTTPSAKLGRAQERNSAISWSGSWKRVALSGASGGYVRKSTAAGSRATYSFSGTAVALVSTRGPSRGIAEIWLDGTKVATIDLYASSLQTSRVVWASGTLTAGSHTLQVRVTGTRNPASSGVRVDVDCFQRWSPAT